MNTSTFEDITVDWEDLAEFVADLFSVKLPVFFNILLKSVGFVWNCVDFVVSNSAQYARVLDLT